MYYKTSASLKNHTLKPGDKVRLARIKYVVTADEDNGNLHLKNATNSYAENGAIFKLLKIDDEHAYCSEQYGYTTSLGVFPETHKADYVGITKVAMALMVRFEKQKTEKLVKLPNSNKMNKFLKGKTKTFFKRLVVMLVFVAIGIIVGLILRSLTEINLNNYLIYAISFVVSAALSFVFVRLMRWKLGWPKVL